MTSPTLLGSQLFINLEDTPARVRSWVRQMAQARLKLIRLFLIWDHLEPAPGQWRFDVYDAVFDEAAACGLQVVPTLMSVSPPGWMLRSGGVQSLANLEDPEILAAAERYLDAVVSHWAPHPALHSWILWNEASRIPPDSPAVRLRFRAFLKRRFDGNIDALNALQFCTYPNFEAIGAGDAAGATELQFAGFAQKVLQQEFAVDELMGHLTRIRDRVRRHDTAHPIHVNPHGLCDYVQHAGQSIWREAALVDFLGCSSHPVWHCTRFPRDRWTAAVGLFADLMASATPAPDRTFWVTELQGGTTLLSAASAASPTPREIIQWLWSGIGAGAKASIFWCFNWRTDGFEAGEWHLLHLDGTPSPRLQAATAVAETLETRADWFAACRPEVPRVVILRSDAAERLAHVDGIGPDTPANPRNRSRPLDSASGAALLLADLDLTPGFVEEAGLAALLADPERRPAALLCPGLEALQDGTLERLADAAAQGVCVIADGPIGWKTPYGRLAPERGPAFARLFGAGLRDVGACNREAPPADGIDAPWWLEIVLDQPSKGPGILLPTWFFARFLLQAYPEARAAFRALLPETVWSGPHLARPGPGCRCRRLTTPDGCVLVLIQETPGHTLSLRLPGPGSLHLHTGKTLHVPAADCVPIPLQVDGVALCRWYPN